MSTNTGIFNLSADNPQPLMHQWFQHHSTYDPVTYRLLFGDVSAKLESLRTASYADIAKQSEEKKDSMQEDPEVQCYSLFWYWQRTGMYRDIVHQFIKPRHSYSAYAHHSVYQHVATPVHFVVCESDETFHFLLNYTEVELGPDANTLSRPDYRHVLFFDDDTPLRNYKQDNTVCSLFYFAEESHNRQKWKQVSERHGIQYGDLFYSLWEDAIVEAERNDLNTKLAVMNDIHQRKRGYLRRTNSLSKLWDFLTEQDELRSTNENHPAAYVVLSTSAFMRYLEELANNTELIDVNGYSLSILNDGSYSVFDARYSMKTSDMIGGKQLREIVGNQFQFIHVMSCTMFSYMTMIANFHSPQLFQRYMPLSIFLMLMSLNSKVDAWYISFDYMIGDIFFPVTNDMKAKASDVLVSSFRLAMVEWHRRKTEKDTQCIVESLLGDDMEETGGGREGGVDGQEKYPPNYFDTHFRPEYKQQLANLTDHSKACKFLVNDFVKCISTIFETSLFVPIYLQLMMRMRIASFPSSELFQLFSLPGYDTRNGFSLETRYDTNVKESWDSEMWIANACTPLFMKQQEANTQQELNYDVYRKVDSWLMSSDFRKLQDVPLSDPKISLSQFMASIRTIHKTIAAHCFRDNEMLELKRLIQCRIEDFSLESSKKRVEDSIRSAVVMESLCTSSDPNSDLVICNSNVGVNADGFCRCPSCEDNIFMSATAAIHSSSALRSLAKQQLKNEKVSPSTWNNFPEIMQFCACTDRACNLHFSEGLRITLSKLETKNDEADGLFLSKIIKNRDKEVECAESDRQFLESLRLLKYADANFKKEMLARRSEVCQMACRPCASYTDEAPFVVVHAHHLSKTDFQNRLSSLLAMFSEMQRTLVICSDDEELLVQTSLLPKGENVEMYSQTTFFVMMATDKDLNHEEFASRFDRIVFLSTVNPADSLYITIDLGEEKVSLEQFYKKIFCTDCNDCNHLHANVKEKLYQRSVVDRFMEDDGVLRFFHSFFRAKRSTQSFRHVWTFQVFEEKHVPEYSQTWRIPSYGNYDIDWIVAVGAIRDVDDLVLKLLWACRVPREKSSFHAHFPEKAYRDFHNRHYSDLDVLICKQIIQDNQELHSMNFQTGRLIVEESYSNGKVKFTKHTSEIKQDQTSFSPSSSAASLRSTRGNEDCHDEQPTAEEMVNSALKSVMVAKAREKDKKRASFEFIRVLLREYHYMWKQNRKTAQDFFQILWSKYRPYFS